MRTIIAERELFGISYEVFNDYVVYFYAQYCFFCIRDFCTLINIEGKTAEIMGIPVLH